MLSNNRDDDTPAGGPTQLLPSPHGDQSLESMSMMSVDADRKDMRNRSRLMDTSDIPMLEPYCVLRCEKKIRVTCLCMTTHQELFSGHADGAIREWQIATGDCLQVMDTR
jgi:hypothetical protein